MRVRIALLLLLGASTYAQTGTFTPTGNMTAPRFNHTATLLPDGKVLIAGGFTTCYIGGPCLGPDHAELYDPATGTFTATTADAAGGVLLPDGRFLLIAGSGRMEFYDRYTGEFTAGKPATLTSVSIADRAGRALHHRQYGPVSRRRAEGLPGLRL
jgi:hypothetical protein